MQVTIRYDRLVKCYSVFSLVYMTGGETLTGS